MRFAAWVQAVLQNHRGGVPRPRWCTYLVSFRCNARCGMCDSWRLDPGEEMTPAQVATVFGKLGSLDVVRLSGGEPFLRKDLVEVAEAVWGAARPLVLHITTNGSWPARVFEFVERFSAPRRLHIMVSFDGLAREHDRNRGGAASFAKAFETVRGLAERRDRMGITVTANHTVVSPQSMADHRDLREALGEQGADVHSVLAYADSAMYGVKYHGRSADGLVAPTGYPLHPALKGADACGFVERELKHLGKCDSWWLRRGKRYYLRGLLARLRGESDPRPHPRCVALRSHIRLLPDGRVPICQFNTSVVGNLYRQSFESVWHDGQSAVGRHWVDRCPGCWAECEVIPNSIYTADILRG